jgi:hypothetical protein
MPAPGTIIDTAVVDVQPNMATSHHLMHLTLHIVLTTNESAIRLHDHFIIARAKDGTGTCTHL